MRPTNCPECSNLIVEKSGVSKKTNKPYHFWGCSAYPKCEYVYQEEKPETPKTSGGFQKAVGGNEEIMNALREIYKEIDDSVIRFKCRLATRLAKNMSDKLFSLEPNWRKGFWPRKDQYDKFINSNSSS